MESGASCVGGQAIEAGCPASGVLGSQALVEDLYVLDRNLSAALAGGEGDGHELGAVRAGPDLPGGGELARGVDEGEPARDGDRRAIRERVVEQVAAADDRLDG